MLVRLLLDDVLALKEFMWHQLIVFFLEVSENFSHSVIYGFCCVISDIRKIRLLDYGDDLLNACLQDYCHFAKKTHLLGVCNYHV